MHLKYFQIHLNVMHLNTQTKWTLILGSIFWTIVQLLTLTCFYILMMRQNFKEKFENYLRKKIRIVKIRLTFENCKNMSNRFCLDVKQVLFHIEISLE